MVQIFLRSKADMKIHLGQLIDFVEANRCAEACNIVDALKTDIIKHFSTRGIECKHILDIIMKMRWTLTHGRRDEWRKSRMYEYFTMLRTALATNEEGETLREKISRIYQDVIEDLNTVCSTGNPKDIDTLTDDFLALRQIAEQVSELGQPDIYDKYTKMMEDAGKSQATLNKLNPRKSGDVWTTTKDALGSLSTSFQIFYASVEKLIASLSEPPESKERVKKEPSESLSDLDEDQYAALKSEARDLLFKENWPPGDIAPHLNMTLDDLKDLLDIE